MFYVVWGMILELQFGHIRAHLSNKWLEMPCLSFPVTALKLPVSVISPRQFVQIELSSRPSVCLQIQSEYGQIGIEVFLACCQSKSLSLARKRETAVNLAPECVCYWLRCVSALTTPLGIMWWRPLTLLLSHVLQTVLFFLSAFSRGEFSLDTMLF